MSGANTYTGVTTVSAGSLKAGSATAFNNNGTLTVSGGTFDLNGHNASFTGFGGAGAAAGTITNSGPALRTLTLSANGAVALATVVTGNTALAFANANATTDLFVNSTPSTYTGGVTLLNHTASGTRLRIVSAVVTTGAPGAIVSSPFGTGAITIGQAATDRAGIYFVTAANNTVVNDIIFNTALGTDRRGIRSDVAGIVLSGVVTANLANATFSTNTATGSFSLTGKVTGAFGLETDLTPAGTPATAAVTVTLNNAAENNDYAGNTILGVRGPLALGRSNQIPDGAGKGDVALAGVLRLNGFNDTINGLTGAGAVNGGSGSGTLTVGGRNATASFAGGIADSGGVVSLTKIGTGVQTLTGVANTHTGPTNVNAGSLIINGSLSASPVSVNATGTLGGTGSVAGPVTVNAGGTLAPGVGATGTLSTGPASLANATATLAIEVDGAAADKLVSTGAVTLGGPLTVTLLAGGFTAPSYIIAEGASLSGTFSSVPAGYAVTYTATQAILSQATGTPFSTWMDTFTSIPPADRDPMDDPDHDGVSNLLEFATGGIPNDGSNPGKMAGVVQDTSAPVGQDFSVVLAVRDGAVFAADANGSQVATVSGITYTVQGSQDLIFPGSSVSAPGAASTPPPRPPGCPPCPARTGNTASLS